MENGKPNIAASRLTDFSAFGINFLTIFESVFDPRSSFSGRFLMEVLAKKPELYKNGRVLDIGCGTGILGLVCASKGATEVTFSDVNPLAVQNAAFNAQELNFNFHTWPAGNLFETARSQIFDFIVFNCPGINGEARNMLEAQTISLPSLVDDFFLQAPRFLEKQGRILMAFSTIHSPLRNPVKIAQERGFANRLEYEKESDKAVQMAYSFEYVD